MVTIMAYSVDLAYLDYFKNAAEGMYDTSPIEDRLKVTGMAAGTALIGVFRTAGRVINLVIELAKIIFYSLAALFTLGNYGNAKRLTDHCKLFTLNAAALIAQPLQVIIHSLATIIGIISPMAAYRTMQVGFTPLAWINSQENAIWQQYHVPEAYTKVSEALKSKTTNIFNKCAWPVELAMKTILNEFSCAFDSALVAPIGYMDQFHSFGANPKTLTDQQKQVIPILLLNGNYSHQATFLPLLHALKLSGNKRPIYTINLPPNTIQPSFISSKIEAIKNQYGKTNEALFEIDMIGHSMGSCLIQNICYAPNKLEVQIRLAITVGTPFLTQAIANKAKAAIDIVGTKDCLSTEKSILPKEHRIKIKTGHLGLLYHHESLNAVTQLLR